MKVKKREIIVCAVPHTINLRVVFENFLDKKHDENSAIPPFYIRTLVSKINVNNFYKN